MRTTFYEEPIQGCIFNDCPHFMGCIARNQDESVVSVSCNYDKRSAVEVKKCQKYR